MRCRGGRRERFRGRVVRGVDDPRIVVPFEEFVSQDSVGDAIEISRLDLPDVQTAVRTFDQQEIIVDSPAESNDGIRLSIGQQNDLSLFEVDQGNAVITGQRAHAVLHFDVEHRRWNVKHENGTGMNGEHMQLCTGCQVPQTYGMIDAAA